MRPRLGGRPGVVPVGVRARRARGAPRATPSGDAPPPSTAPDVAAAEEAALAAALVQVGGAEAPTAAPPPAPTSATNPALAAKLTAAKAASAAYKKAKEEGGGVKAVGVVAPAAAPRVPTPPSPSAPPAAAPALFDRSTPPPPTATRGAAESAAEVGPSGARVWGADAGSETEAAAFLRGAFDGGDASLKEMRMEEITAIKTARERAKGADIITAAPAAPDDASDTAYSPRVATWGVFPRPDNISKAYGGGRTIRPGEAVESADAAAERKARQKAAMNAYRKAAGLEVDPADEKEAARLVGEGDAYLKAGDLRSAADAFAGAATLLPARTTLGGRARLNQAIALDSMGQGEAAFALYKSVERHPAADVARAAKRLLFGFTAAAELKADTISYRARKEEMDPYFGRLRGDYDTAYVPAAGADEGPRPDDLAAALAVVGVPLLLAAGLVFGRG